MIQLVKTGIGHQYIFQRGRVIHNRRKDASVGFINFNTFFQIRYAILPQYTTVPYFPVEKKGPF
jgi:hypothetical protein